MYTLKITCDTAEEAVKLARMIAEDKGPVYVKTPTKPAPRRFIGETVMKLRTRLGLSQVAFGERIGISGAQISLAESGRDPLPRRCEAAFEALLSAPPTPATDKPEVSVSAPSVEKRKPEAPSPFNAPALKVATLSPRRLTPAEDRAKREAKIRTVPLPRQTAAPHGDPCACRHPQRDHEKLFGRCWVCGTGRGEGCQKFIAEKRG